MSGERAPRLDDAAQAADAGPPPDAVSSSEAVRHAKAVHPAATMPPDVFVHRVRVGYIDTDQAGVVHHTVYLAYIEAARIELFRASGIDYRTFERESGLGLPVVGVHLRYRAPARFDDQLEVRTWIGAESRATIAFASEIWRGETRLVDGIVEVACVNVREGRACSVPEIFRRLSSRGAGTSPSASR